jgi:hypothetical protein
MSLAFYLKYPQMTRALMLFDTGPGYRNPQAREGWNQTAYQRAQRFEEGGLAALSGGEEVRTSTHRSAEGLAKAARGMLAQFDSRVIESLEHIKCRPVRCRKKTRRSGGDGPMANGSPAPPSGNRRCGHAVNPHQRVFNDLRRFEGRQGVGAPIACGVARRTPLAKRYIRGVSTWTAGETAGMFAMPSSTLNRLTSDSPRRLCSPQWSWDWPATFSSEALGSESTSRSGAACSR